MQICDNCQSRLPDDVLYCLDCGTRLEEQTVIRPPVTPRIETKADTIPPTPQRSAAFIIADWLAKTIAMAMLFAVGLGVVVAAIVIYGSWGASKANNDAFVRNNAAANAAKAANAARTVPPPSKQTPPPPEPVAVRPQTGCYVWNDKKPDVIVRTQCHIKDCNNDPTATVATVPNGTPVLLSNIRPVYGGRSYTWNVVIIGDVDYYVASNKIFCN